MAERRYFWAESDGRLHGLLGCLVKARHAVTKVGLYEEEYRSHLRCTCLRRHPWEHGAEPLRPLVWMEQVTPDVAVALDDSLTPVLVTTEGKGPRWTISNVAALRDALDTMHAEAVNRRG